MAAIVQTATEISHTFPSSSISTFGISQERGTLSLEAAHGAASPPPPQSATSEYRKRKMSFGVGSFTPANGIQHGMSYAASGGQSMQQQPFASKSQQASIYTVCISPILLLFSDIVQSQDGSGSFKNLFSVYRPFTLESPFMNWLSMGLL